MCASCTINGLSRRASSGPGRRGPSVLMSMHSEPAHGTTGIPSAAEFAKGSAGWFDAPRDVGKRLAGLELKHTRQPRLSPVGLGKFFVRPATCRYGGIGVVIAMTKCGGLPNKGTSIRAARRLACANTEVSNALRRTRRSRARCSGSPSTKQLCSEPTFRWRTDSGSSDIAHLHENWCERLRRDSLRRRPLGYFLRKPTPRSQGCEVARVLPALDTTPEGKFPVSGTKAPLAVKISPENPPLCASQNS